MSKNMSLHNARMNKNDEFYTQMADIENELKYYTEYLKDSIIYCNCDNPETSAFWKYFHLHFAELGLKKLISTYYIPQMFVWDIGAEKPFAMIYEGGNDSDISVGDKIQLKGNGDFRSAECINYLKESDIIITNPPFSLFREFVTQLIEYDKKFIILGNMNAVTYKEIFPLFMNNRMWYGYSIHSGDRKFYVPDSYPLNASGCGIDNDGKRYIKVKGIRWFTNLDHKQRHEELILSEKYSPEKYLHYDNYDAINVDKYSEIPCDYDGIMGVPITFLDHYNPNQFEIVGIDGGNMGVTYGISATLTKDECVKLYNENNGFRRGSLCYRDMSNTLLICYRRILIHKK